MRNVEANVAIEVVQLGREALSLRSIARQRGVSPATLVRRWGSVDQMFDAILIRMLAR
ncbi:TetR family transcriptional regulator [Nocardioides mangrovicus]|uniref:TetR family transcriptional regulator n=1 Tax=Nocardioides mangrovicus TaxID=2478913 RepID=A0A3L8P1J4_9ACTN|nr:TetR family transcriptional regulator [Nocardioides mangrovicus]